MNSHWEASSTPNRAVEVADKVCGLVAVGIKIREPPYPPKTFFWEGEFIVTF